MKQSPHVWWTIILMFVVIVALVAFVLTDMVLQGDIIMEFISYASSILSITLSIFAIQYTYTSNNQIQQQFEKINTAAENIKDTAARLNNTNQDLEKNLSAILDKLEHIDASQREISTSIDNLNSNKLPQIPKNYEQKRFRFVKIDENNTTK